jgi:hypothetical protein
VKELEIFVQPSSAFPQSDRVLQLKIHATTTTNAQKIFALIFAINLAVAMIQTLSTE